MPSARGVPTKKKTFKNQIIKTQTRHTHTPHHLYFATPVRTPPCLHPRQASCACCCSPSPHRRFPPGPAGTSTPPPPPHHHPAPAASGTRRPQPRHPTATTPLPTPQPPAPGDSAAAVPTGCYRSPAAPGSPHRRGEAPPGDARPAPGLRRATALLRAPSCCRRCLLPRLTTTTVSAAALPAAPPGSGAFPPPARPNPSATGPSSGPPRRDSDRAEQGARGKQLPPHPLSAPPPVPRPP